jgi:hypothetical protein
MAPINKPCANWKLILIAKTFVWGKEKKTDHVVPEVRTTVIMNIYTFYDIMQRSPVKIDGSFDGTCVVHLKGKNCTRLPAYFMLISFFAQSSALKMDSTSTSKKSVDFHQTTRRYIISSILRSSINLLWRKSYMLQVLFTKWVRINTGCRRKNVQNYEIEEVCWFDCNLHNLYRTCLSISKIFIKFDRIVIGKKNSF